MKSNKRLYCLTPDKYIYILPMEMWLQLSDTIKAPIYRYAYSKRQFITYAQRYLAIMLGMRPYDIYINSDDIQIIGEI